MLHWAIERRLNGYQTRRSKCSVIARPLQVAANLPGSGKLKVMFFPLRLTCTSENRLKTPPLLQTNARMMSVLLNPVFGGIKADANSNTVSGADRKVGLWIAAENVTFLTVLQVW